MRKHVHSLCSSCINRHGKWTSYCDDAWLGKVYLYWELLCSLCPRKLENGECSSITDYCILRHWKNAYLLPRIQESIGQLGKAKHLSSNAPCRSIGSYASLRTISQRTAFNTWYIKYWLCGDTNAPATFQTLMDSILRPHNDKLVSVYLDDILVDSILEDEQEPPEIGNRSATVVFLVSTAR